MEDPPVDREDGERESHLGTRAGGSGTFLKNWAFACRPGRYASIGLRACRGSKGPTSQSAFKFLYMILYIGGGHTEGFAVLAFVCFE